MVTLSALPSVNSTPISAMKSIQLLGIFKPTNFVHGFGLGSLNLFAGLPSSVGNCTVGIRSKLRPLIPRSRSIPYGVPGQNSALL